MLRDPLRFLRDLRQRYGDVVKVRHDRRWWVLFSRPDHVDELFAYPSEALAPGAAIRIALPNAPVPSLATADGEAHRRMRNAERPITEMGRHPRYQAILRRAIFGQVERRGREDLNLTEVMEDAAVEFAARAIFGVDGGELPRSVVACLRDPSRPMTLRQMMMLGLPWARGPLVPSALVRFARDQIGRDPGRSRTPFAIALTDSAEETAREPAGGDAPERSGEFLASTAMRFAVTIAGMFPHIFHHLVLEREVCDRLYQEARAEGPEPRSRSYSWAVIREVLRVCPEIPAILRYCAGDVRVAGFNIPSRTIACAVCYLTHHRSDVFRSPDQFNPDRFMTRRFELCEFYPFGGPGRGCAAALLVPRLLEQTLREIVLAFEIRGGARRDNPPVPSRSQFAIVRRHPIRATLTPRRL